ncbi:MAG: alpha/beta hydrolase [Bacteroidales bacterium]|nr:alpha/beta hydrolase [Bacteroidales bacterium]
MKRGIYIMIAGLLFGMSIFAQNNEIIQEEIIYKTINGISLKADLFYLAETGDMKAHPAIAFFHGGGWSYGSPSEFHEACTRYARKGFITFSFHYRLSVNEDGTVPHPDITPVESVKDTRSALRWIRENAEKFNIDPGRIVACGQSAGGQLALSAALIDDVNEESDNLDISPVPAAIVLYSSNVNTMEAWVDRLMGNRRNEIWSISPHHNLKSGLPPIIAFHGEEDCMVPIWVVRHFKEKITRLNNDFELIVFDGRKHYLGDEDPQYGRYYDEEIFKMTDEFLIKHGFLDPSAPVF